MSVDAAIAAIAARQFNLITLRQVFECGGGADFARRRVRRGHWQRLAPTIYRVGVSSDPWRQRVLAPILAAGDGLVASHRCAAGLHALDGIAPGLVELAGTRSRHVPGAIVRRISGVLPADIVEVDGIPATSVVRTLVDLAGVVDPAVLERAVEGALREGRVTQAQLAWRGRLLRARGRPGTTAFRQLLAMRAGALPTGSDLETLFLQLIRTAGLPVPKRQVRVRLAGGRSATVDFAYPDRRIAIELDGWSSHGTKVAFGADRSRQNALVVKGWSVLRFTWDDVIRRPDHVIAILTAALAA